MPATPKYLTLTELSRQLGFCAKTIRKAVRAGLPCHRLTPGTAPLFLLAEVRDHMQRLGEQTPATPAPRKKRKLRVPEEVKERLRAQGFKV